MADANAVTDNAILDNVTDSPQSDAEIRYSPDQPKCW